MGSSDAAPALRLVFQPTLCPVALAGEDADLPQQTRRFAKSIAEICTSDTEEVMGWLYRWDDGTESQVLLKDLPSHWSAPNDTDADALPPWRSSDNSTDAPASGID